MNQAPPGTVGEVCWHEKMGQVAGFNGHCEVLHEECSVHFDLKNKTKQKHI